MQTSAISETHIPTGTVRDMARVLAHSRSQRCRIAWQPGAVSTEIVAYQIQQALHAEFYAKGLQHVGWKVAASTPAQFSALGLTRPAVGGVLARDAAASGARKRMDRFVKVGIETELALRVGPAIASAVYPLSRHCAASIVESAQLALEIIDNRYVDLPSLDGPTRIADDFLQAGCVLGQEVDNWHALDFAHLQGELRCDGETIAICAADPAFDALAALTYVANLLAELGRPLRSGEFVLTGSLHKPYFLNRRGLYQSWVGNVGQVEVAFV